MKPVTDDLTRIREHFVHFARDAAASSPLYERLAQAVVEHDDIAAILLAAPPAQQNPTLLFASIHSLLLGGMQHELAAFFPSVGGNRTDDPLPALRDFCRRHRADLESMCATRATQTNEIGRGAFLLPAFGEIARRSGRPLALVEIGSSAGLLLNLDRYHYDYGTHGSAGDAAGPRVAPALRGDLVPPLPDGLEIAARLGIDLDPVSPGDEERVRWLRACLWPEQHDRAERFLRAIDIARAHPPEVLRGNGVDLLAEACASMPPDAAVVVFHCAVSFYLAREDRRALPREIARARAGREIWWLSAEGNRTAARWFPEVAPHVREDGVALALSPPHGPAELLAFAGWHGQWVEWRAH